jgi:hypothetical protein
MIDENEDNGLTDARSDLMKAFESVESKESGTGATEDTSHDGAIEPTKSGTGTKEPGSESGDARDTKGRFTPKKAPVDSGAVPGVEGEIGKDQQAKSDAKPIASTVKAPQSWKPEMREKFAALPPEVQQEVVRREREITNALNESTEHRKASAKLREVIGPYEGMIRAEGGNVYSAISSLMQTAQALRTSPPAHKAQLVAQLVNQFGVDIGMLDQALAGQAPHGQPATSQIDPRQAVREEIENYRQQAEAQRSAAAYREAQSETVSFAESHEFMEDVRTRMATILEVNAREGVVVSMEEAYNEACSLHPEVSKIVRQREAAKAASTGTSATARSKTASSSVRSSPVSGIEGADKPEGLRGDLLSAARKHDW